MISSLICVMTLVFGEQKLGGVFQKKCIIKMKKDITPFLHFVTGQSSIAWTKIYQPVDNIVQIETKAVKRKSISSAMKAKHAHQMVVTILLTFLQIKLLQEFFNFRKDL